jgi:CTP:molybdopterin cytidylyltransferase MocA
VLAATPASALADADGLPRVRRIADAAWAGGAIPTVVVSFDPEGGVTAALTGSTATLAEPAPREVGPAGQLARGMEVAAGIVRETDAVLLWPARMGWVGPETITSLIEAHGTRPEALVRPAYRGEPGWPVLLPMAALPALRAVSPDRMPDAVLADLVDGGLALEVVELGDPGTSIDGDTARGELPPYEGPPGPAAGHVHEWGDDVAALPETPAAPATVPYDDVPSG